MTTLFQSYLDHHVVFVSAGEAIGAGVDGRILRRRARPENLFHRQPDIGPGRRNAGSAKRAIRVVLEPDIDAIYVENMAAIRYGS